MIKVIDGALPPEIFFPLQEYVMQHAPWHYIHNMDYGDIYDQDWTDGFTTPIIMRSTNSPVWYCQEYRAFATMFDYIQENFGLKTIDITRSKCNLTTKIPYEIPRPAHKDDDYLQNYTIGVLYINDSDGDTIIFDSKDPNDIKRTDLPIKEVVHPKENRLVLFDGNYLHASSRPLLSPTRFVINFNWKNDD